METWLNNKWRPAMGWTYMVICIMDFIVFPTMWMAITQASGVASGAFNWEPLTLKGAGLFHVAMGAVLGITAWSRGQEKINNVMDFNRSTKLTSSSKIPQPRHELL